ncbi:MAG: SAM-dependent methyltransferase [Acidimicrobiales bacterium]
MTTPPSSGAPSPEDLLVERIRRHGPVGFDALVEAALYAPGTGFFAAGGRAGRGGDFLTSPEVGPLFGAVVARALDAWWHELGAPDPFVVVEAGAGSGTLAVAVRAAAPACSPALTYVLVERSPALRARHGEHLPLTVPTQALPPAPLDDDDPVPTADGPRFTSLADLPAGPLTGVVLANELLDNLPLRVLERTAAGGWREVAYTLVDDRPPITECLVPIDDDLAARADRWAPEAAPGQRIPVLTDALDWVRRALEVLDRGRIVVVDYGAPTSVLAARPASGWLRTFRGHERGGPPHEHLGEQDITVDVPVDQLAAVARPDAEADQATWLATHGLAELVAEGRRTWSERAHVGDLEALKARSRVREAEALTDPGGLGAFRVLEWRR